MPIRIGVVKALFRYPVKSMSGESVEAGDLGWHGLDSDRRLALFSDDRAADVGRRHGSPVDMMHLSRGIFDEASISVLTSAAVDEIGRLASQPSDVRRFRPKRKASTSFFNALVVAVERGVSECSHQTWQRR